MMNISTLLFQIKNIATIVAQADEGVLKNPVIGDLGNRSVDAKSGGLFIEYSIRMWRMAINIGALIVLAFYIIAAYEWLSSGSETQGVEKAKKRFTHATIGLVLLVASFAIVAFISNLLFGSDFNLLELTFPI